MIPISQGDKEHISRDDASEADIAGETLFGDEEIKMYGLHDYGFGPDMKELGQ